MSSVQTIKFFFLQFNAKSYEYLNGSTTIARNSALRYNRLHIVMTLLMAVLISGGSPEFETYHKAVL